MALPVRVQSNSNTSVLTSVTATFSSTPISGNLMVPAVTSDVGAGSVAIAGWTAIGNKAVGLAGSLDLFYKFAGVAENPAIQSTATLATFMDLHIYEYSGIDPVMGVNSSTADSGLGVTTLSSGTTTLVTNASSLTFVAVAQALTNGAGSSWTNGYSTGITTTHLITADLINFTNAAQESTASWITSQRAAGLITTFMPLRGNTYYQGGGR